MKKKKILLNFSLSTSAPKSSRALHSDFDSVKKMKINKRKQNIISQTSIWKSTSLYKCWTDMLDCKPISLTMRSEWVGMLFSQPSYSNSHSQCKSYNIILHILHSSSQMYPHMLYWIWGAKDEQEPPPLLLTFAIRLLVPTCTSHVNSKVVDVVAFVN